MISEISFLWRHTLVLYRCIESDYSSHALEVLILFFNLTVWTQKAKRAKRFHSLQYWLLRLTNRITDKWTVGYLSVHVFSTKVLIEDTIFTSHTGDAWDLHFMWSSKPRKSFSHLQQGKGSFFISQSYQERQNGLLVRPREWNPRPPAQAVRRLSDWVAYYQALRAALALESHEKLARGFQWRGSFDGWWWNFSNFDGWRLKFRVFDSWQLCVRFGRCKGRHLNQGCSNVASNSRPG